ncbi:hypothetical protein CC1G_04460 [Coprinopsis cinerea okayama7|uniref:F-box domain-containing protein n=1 Tax=Coprinopsis cinerea (strain Okayama-7 / 130 / ATCC MYA-4618 / FGSC 9003) TaxID=240176 RepID=A8N578_COPC7|nr:hypothetical protein CC1G_04460 [Coprinopsis cinerea okayama7\|eukprot:XP_001830027.1 hypothetical protein CC1G_04460 [Coprinopsis cinerea okayama7\
MLNELVPQVTASQAITSWSNAFDIICRVAEKVDWIDVALFASVCRTWRHAVQKEVENRIREALEPNLTALGLSFQDFVAALDEADGALIGNCVLSITYRRTKWAKAYDRIPRLTVVVPSGRRETFIGLLGKSEWRWIPQPVGMGARHVVRGIWEVTLQRRPGETQGTFPTLQNMNDAPDDPIDHLFENWEGWNDEDTLLSRRRREWRRISKVYLRVIESKSQVLQVAFTADTTRDMVLLTSRRFYHLFPKVQHAHLGLIGRSGISRGDNNVIVPQMCRDNSEWPWRCGKLCPIFPRKGREGDGTGVFFWNQNIEREALAEGAMEIDVGWGNAYDGWNTDLEWASKTWAERKREWPKAHTMALLNVGSLLDRSQFKATLAKTCVNPHCENHGKRAVCFVEVDMWFESAPSTDVE